jgi:hypothetical protein
MRIGASLALITLGAIIAFGIRADPESVNLDVVGLIMVLIGIVGLVMNHFVWERRKEAARIQGLPLDPYVDPEAPPPAREDPRLTE